MVERNYEPAFALRWMHKDTTYAMQAAGEYGVPMPTLAAAREVYQMAITLGYGDQDFAAVGEAIRGRAEGDSPR